MEKETWVDSSACSHLAQCPCGWSRLFLSQQEAYAALMKHEAGWHPDRRSARIAAYQFTARHSDTRRPGNTPQNPGKRK
ncbi:MAG: hypothetical protein MSC45_05285 [Mobiluncus sp.]|uniref:hypothetical protein n=1 Tax=Mobiluncus sp. TaxID=47293 RepID=UPI0025883726|nr:hypothetical protein [Mobiluncus sp.]MCI6584464.1 hypothetical protein [Mobiluncus sp.]